MFWYIKPGLSWKESVQLLEKINWEQIWDVTQIGTESCIELNILGLKLGWRLGYNHGRNLEDSGMTSGFHLESYRIGLKKRHGKNLRYVLEITGLEPGIVLGKSQGGTGKTLGYIGIELAKNLRQNIERQQSSLALQH